jgi:hypothetical protein
VSGLRRARVPEHPDEPVEGRRGRVLEVDHQYLENATSADSSMSHPRQSRHA